MSIRFSLFLFLVFNISFQTVTFSQSNDLLSGPMLGYNTMREVGIWVQAQDESEIKIKYWNSSDRSKVKITKSINTIEEKANTATVSLGYLEPGTTYTYQIYVCLLYTSPSPRD